MSYSVYIAVNIINGKRYIGVTGKGVEKRAKKHWEAARAGSSQCPKFHAALRKYGPDRFVWKVLFETDDMAEAYRQEHLLVQDTTPEYNSAAGGRSPAAWNKRPVLCLEDGLVHESAVATADFYQIDISEVCKVIRGERRWAGCLHFCYADAAPISHAEAIEIIDQRFVQKRRRVVVRKERYEGVKEGRDTKGRLATGPMANARKVLCVEDNKIFDSLSEAARYYDVDAGALSQVCGNKRFRKTAGGKSFRYTEAIH